MTGQALGFNSQIPLQGSILNSSRISVPEISSALQVGDRWRCKVARDIPGMAAISSAV